MSRVKEFNAAAVLDGALELFRTQGYAETSFADLTGRLGVSRQSLYDTYGDKQALYRAALQRYGERVSDLLRAKLAEPAPIRQVLGELLGAVIHRQCQGHGGCLMVNSMVERCPSDPDTRAAAQAHARIWEGLFASRLSAAQRRGEIGADKDPIELARFFYHLFLGIAVGARSVGDEESLAQTARVALHVLD